MRQTITYGIIGKGRLGSHLAHYFDLLNISYQAWDHKDKAEITQSLNKSNVYLIAIKDDAIESFIQNHPFLSQKPCIHFSGALTTSLAQGFHPHFNFTKDFYSKEIYTEIPFVCEQGSCTFDEIFPELPNPYFTIQSKHRAKYHALCVMSGNFPTLLWQETAKQYQQMGLPKDLLHAYLKNITDSFIENPDGALTGPFARKDHQTIQKNTESLTDPLLKNIYTAFKKKFLK